MQLVLQFEATEHIAVNDGILDGDDIVFGDSSRITTINTESFACVLCVIRGRTFTGCGGICGLQSNMAVFDNNDIVVGNRTFRNVIWVVHMSRIQAVGIETSTADDTEFCS